MENKSKIVENESEVYQTSLEMYIDENFGSESKAYDDRNASHSKADYDSKYCEIPTLVMNDSDNIDMCENHDQNIGDADISEAIGATVTDKNSFRRRSTPALTLKNILFNKKRPYLFYIPFNPYKMPFIALKILEVTELPFLILWIYFTYFLVIVAYMFNKAKSTIWLSAAIPAILVGIGLNANAYTSIMMKGSPDYGMIIRFFIIPFAVSALSGLTNTAREDFVLFFPKDTYHLLLSIFVPAIVVITFIMCRICLLAYFRVPVGIKNILFNREIYV